MNLSAVDLNLLVVVDAVLRERSATGAASRLHVTQSAVSNAIGRAREVFGDELVVRAGRGFALTPHAHRLAPKIAELLENVRTILDSDAEQPEHTTRRFTIACTDALNVVLTPRVLARFRRHFPRASLRMVTLDRAMMIGLESAEVDLLVGAPPRTPAGCEAEVLFEDRMVVIASADNEAVGRRLSLDAFATLPHAELALFGEADAAVDRALALRNRRRRIDVVVPHVTVLPFLVHGSDRIATTIESVARAVAAPLALRVLTPPVPLAPLVVRQVWHRRVADDPNVALLRELVRQSCPLR